ncbi:MAG: hypothetical protein HOF70_13015, partial [Rhodospirillaceae bacterium]|nr:hypothetical protein [Rhodospirillaceae bacterium]
EKAFEERARSSAEATEENIKRLKDIGDRIRRQTRETGDATDEVAERMDSAGNSLRQQLDGVTESFDKAAQGMEAASDSVDKSANQAEAARRRASADMDAWNTKVKRGADDLESIANRINSETRDTVDQVAKQTKDLERLSGKATKISDALNEQSEELGTKEFLRRMSLVREGLESVAIDINRIMETRISEDDWQKYNKGDKSVFLRKILGMRSKSKLAKVSKLYREKSEFRDYVNRYLSQFDKMIESAKRSDQGGVLGATFMTSDAGKVYLILRAALSGAGRDEG